MIAFPLLYYWLSVAVRHTDYSGLTAQQRRHIMRLQTAMLQAARLQRHRELGNRLDSCAVSPIAQKSLQ